MRLGLESQHGHEKATHPQEFRGGGWISDVLIGAGPKSKWRETDWEIHELST